ncbi:hypothetical protein [Methylobacterium pseudosasicola]|uniref:Uncharacterized protein n=1 Tax=Methylobacterium pseudosasicola TaxID=582667 RepID=A0A1I4S8N9_9HYPH|nr:hypothetical protein [Methylobacterium pseudosasicola]SFM60701.1 hypothetical protein SAMN05192568_104059 [Methylobacterium pseudosasicola]
MADHIAERHVITAFVADPTTQSASKPFAQTSAVHQICRQRASEFRSFDVEAAGLTCLLTAVSLLSVDEMLVQEILRSGPHTANVFHRGDGIRIVGAVLYGKPGVGLPTIPMPRSMRPALSLRARRPIEQLDLFARTEV